MFAMLPMPFTYRTTATTAAHAITASSTLSHQVSRIRQLCVADAAWRRMRRRTIQFNAPNTAYNTANTGAVARSQRCVRSGIGVFGRPVM